MSSVTVSGVEFDVIKYVALDEQGELQTVPSNFPTAKPVLNVPMMSDYKYQLMCLNDRIEHPEKYEDSEDVPQTIERLKKWLSEHTPT